MDSPSLPPDLLADLPPAVVAYIRWLETRVGHLEGRAADLEAKLNRNSTNSSRPPSSDPPAVKRAPPRPATGKRPGGQPRHPKHERALVEHPDHVRECKPAACRRCRRPLTGADPEPLRHQVTDLPPVRPVVTEYHFAYELSRVRIKMTDPEHDKLFDKKWSFDWRPTAAREANFKDANGDPRLQSAATPRVDYVSAWKNKSDFWSDRYLLETVLVVGVACQCDANKKLFINQLLDGDYITVHLQRMHDGVKHYVYVQFGGAPPAGVPLLEQAPGEWIKVMNDTLGKKLGWKAEGKDHF